MKNAITITNVVAIYTAKQGDSIRHIAVRTAAGGIHEFVLYADKFATCPKKKGLRIRPCRNAYIAARRIDK